MKRSQRVKMKCLQALVRTGSLTGTGNRVSDGRINWNARVVARLVLDGLAMVEPGPFGFPRSFKVWPTEAGQAKALEFQGQAKRSKS